eukprot:scaffold35859_cov16-Tisochrysis_lutea.AAC.1
MVLKEGTRSGDAANSLTRAQALAHFSGAAMYGLPFDLKKSSKAHCFVASMIALASLPKLIEHQPEDSQPEDSR